MNGITGVLVRVAGGFVLAAWMLSGTAARAAYADTVLSEDDKACLDCHGSEENAAKHATNGRKAQVIQVDAYARSVHGDVGCDGCHPKIRLPAHPDKATPASSTQYQPKGAVIQVCRACHAKVVKAFDRSVHAQALRVRSKSAPDCNDCHQPHAITTASLQDGPKNACLDCHDDPAVSHRKWLPNAVRHLQAVACAACHAPEAMTRVDLRLAVRAGDIQDISGAFEQLAARVDTKHDGLDAHEFRALLEAFESRGTPVSVRGRIELRNGVKAHMLPDKTQALRDCFGCHDEDAPPYKRVTVSTQDANGGLVRYDAQRQILTSTVTIEALKGFYALGGTRLAQLDLLLALGLGFGISVPGLHFLARRLMKRPRPDKDPTP